MNEENDITTDITKDTSPTKIQKEGMVFLKFNRTLDEREIIEMHHQITAALKQLGFKEDEVEILLVRTTLDGETDIKE